MQEYDPEAYWSRVGQDIQKRGENFVAGDDNPFYRYKREKFLARFLDTIDFENKTVLEVGFGPGGNLRHIAQHHKSRKLLGVDIAQTMHDLASRNLAPCRQPVELHKIDGRELPFPDKSVDLTFTVTVLQHNTIEDMFVRMVGEIGRVTSDEAVIMEDIGTSPKRGAEGSFVRRQVDVYRKVFAKSGFRLADVSFLNTRVSSFWHNLVFLQLYKRLAGRRQTEGEPIGAVIRTLIGGPLPLMRILDILWVEKKHLAKMVFRRE